MERIKRSWQLAKASLEVLKKDKELMIFPILSFIGVVIISLSFAIPTFLSRVMDTFASTGIPFFAYVVLFLFYVVQYSVVFFCNTALVGAAMIRLRGGDPTVGDGFRIAFSRFGAILGWAVISATVGVVLHALSNNKNKKGVGISNLIKQVLGAAWNVVTFLVVPVLAVEGLSPFKAIERSWNLLKKSWGEQIAGTLSIGAVFALIGFLGSLVLIGAGVGLTMWLESAVPAIVFGILLFLFIVILSLISSTLSGIFTAAVYGYAADGQVGLIDEGLIRGAVQAGG